LTSEIGQTWLPRAKILRSRIAPISAHELLMSTMHSQTIHERKTISTNSTISWIIAATSFGFVVVQLDVTIVNVALQTISTDLRASMAGLQWVVDAYALVFAVLLLSAGVLGDRFGAKRAFSVGFLLFGLASLACGIAPTAPFLIGARAMQGIGAALLVPSSLALLNHACENDARRRAHAIALWTASGGVAIGRALGNIKDWSATSETILFVPRSRTYPLTETVVTSHVIR